MNSMPWLRSLGKVIDMASSIFVVCKDCQDRTVGCHSTCQKYQAAKAEYQKSIDAIQKLKDAEDCIDDVKTRSVLRVKRRHGINHGRRY